MRLTNPKLPGTSGHQGRVNEYVFDVTCDHSSQHCGLVSATSAATMLVVMSRPSLVRLSSVSPSFGDNSLLIDDKMLLVWDMHPPEPQSREDPGWTPMMSTRPVPVAFAHPQAYPLKSVESHPTSSRELLVADAVGNIILTDWRADESVELTQRSTELVHPRALADKVTGLLPKSGSVSWRSDNMWVICVSALAITAPDYTCSVGAVYSSSVALWDLNINGKPTFTGTSFPEGGHRFRQVFLRIDAPYTDQECVGRWCRPFPEYFAVSSLSGVKGALISVWNMQFLHAPPKTFVLASKPIKVADFDFLGGSTAVPRIAAAFGHEIMVFAIGE
jgi:hypothetical protein